MAVAACHCDLSPRQALSVGDDANIDAFGLKDWALFDVEFEERVHLALANRFFAAPADAFEFIAKLEARRVLFRIGFVLRDDPREHRRGHHGRGKARALFIGPVHDRNRVFGLNAQIVEGADNF